MSTRFHSQHVTTWRMAKFVKTQTNKMFFLVGLSQILRSFFFEARASDHCGWCEQMTEMPVSLVIWRTVLCVPGAFFLLNVLVRACSHVDHCRTCRLQTQSCRPLPDLSSADPVISCRPLPDMSSADRPSHVMSTTAGHVVCRSSHINLIHQAFNRSKRPVHFWEFVHYSFCTISFSTLSTLIKTFSSDNILFINIPWHHAWRMRRASAG